MVEKAASATPGGADAKPSKKNEKIQPSSWWQWILVYPTLAIALISAVPDWMTAVKSVTAGISFQAASEAAEQSGYWERNRTCIQIPPDYLETPQKVSVNSIICRSGDVLIEAVTPDNKRRFYWVGLDRMLAAIKNDKRTVSLFSSPAFAHPRPLLDQQRPRATLIDNYVMCQRFIDDRKLLRVVNIDGQCFDEIIDTFNGVLIESQESECRSTC